MPFRDFKNKETIVNNLYEPDYDEFGNLSMSIDNKLYAAEINELKEAKTLYNTSKTTKLNEVIELFRQFNLQCKTYLTSQINYSQIAK